MHKKGLALAGVLLLGACSSVGDWLEGKNKAPYQTASTLPPLEVPPDLTAPSRDNRYVVPESATLSGYQAERRQAKPGASGVLPTFDDMRVERAGTQRWLVVAQPPEKVWPAVKDFWQENGFLLKTELPQVGVMETEWAEHRERVPEGGIRGLVGRLLEQSYTTAERDKFRTRLERAAHGKGTEIYIAHYGMEEVYTSRDAFTGQPTDTRWQPRPSDPGIEAEFLRRLMIRLGASEEEAAEALKTAAAAPERARITQGANGALLVVEDPFDRAWRRVGLALDRVGFTVEDRDRTKGVYFVRYADPEADVNKPSFLDRILGTGRKLVAHQYQVHITEAGSNSRVSVLDKDGAPVESASAQRILALLHEQLK
ncbi:MAG TPA: outer membrane protein assembly factor BamC [Burkholderiales bacterium]